MNMNGHTRLYHHKTDGGAEYLSPVAIPGTDEGAFEGAAFTIRLDGEPEFSGPPIAVIAGAGELLEACKQTWHYIHSLKRPGEDRDNPSYTVNIIESVFAAAIEHVERGQVRHNLKERRGS